MNVPVNFVTMTLASFRTELERRFSDFTGHKDSQTHLFFEMDDYKIEGASSRIECRIDGPLIPLTGAADELVAYVEVNLLVCSTWNPQDIYGHAKICDRAVFMVAKDIFLKDLGRPDSSKNTLGCYQIDGRGINVVHHGQIDPAVRLYQSSIEVHFKYTQ